MGNWYRVDIAIGNDAIEPLSGGLLELSPSGVQIEDRGNTSVLTVYLPDSIPQDKLSSSLSGLLDKIAASGFDVSTAEINVTRITDENWADNYKQFFHPLRIGRLLIKPSWERVDESSGEFVIQLDPGLAFGTGSHPTTEGCLCTLQKVVEGGEMVLDIGTGSGILAIAAVKLGSKRVIAIDNDPVAIDVARQNAADNNTASQIGFEVADIAQFGPISADIVVANMTAPVIIKLLPQIVENVIGFKRFIASGITEEQKDGVIEALSANGLIVVELFEKNRWVTLVCGRG